MVMMLVAMVTMMVVVTIMLVTMVMVVTMVTVFITMVMMRLMVMSMMMMILLFFVVVQVMGMLVFVAMGMVVMVTMFLCFLQDPHDVPEMSPPAAARFLSWLVVRMGLPAGFLSWLVACCTLQLIFAFICKSNPSSEVVFFLISHKKLPTKC